VYNLLSLNTTKPTLSVTRMEVTDSKFKTNPKPDKAKSKGVSSQNTCSACDIPLQYTAKGVPDS